MGRHILIWQSVVVAAGCVGLIAGSPTAQATASTKVEVNPDTGFQTLEGWGTSLAWFGYVAGGAPDKMRNQVADLLFNPKTGLGLNVVRYNIGGGENPKYHSMEFRAAVPGYEPRPGTWDWNADATQRWFLQAAMQRGADEQEAFSNSPPYWMTISGSVTGAKDGGDNLKQADYGAFAQYLAKVVQHFQTQWRVTFRSVEPFNEPMSNWWKFGGHQEGSHFGQEAQNRVVPLLQRELAAEKSMTTISAPDDNSIDETYLNLTNYPNSVRNDISQVNTHSYNGTARGSLAALAAKDGKGLWMSEYGDGDETGLTMSEQIVQDMKQMQPTAWIYWQALDGASSDNNGWGMLAASLGSFAVNQYSVNEKYYVMGNYSRFIRPGDQFIAVDDDQSVAAYDWNSQTLTLVSTNDNLTSRIVNFDVSRFGTATSTVHAYQTTRFHGTENLKPVPVGTIHSGTLTVKLPGFSVTTFAVSNAQYSPAGETWKIKSPSIGTSITYPFTGTRVLLKGNRGPSSGIAQIAIDHAAFVDLDLYSEQVHNGAVVYGSPTLKSGTHTVTIRSSGRKSSLSSGYRIDMTDGVTLSQ